MVELEKRVNESLGHEYPKYQIPKDNWLDVNGLAVILASVCVISPVLFIERHRIPEFIRNLYESLPIGK